MTDEPGYRSHVGRGDEDSGNSLLPMLIGSLVLIVIGMLAVAALV